MLEQRAKFAAQAMPGQQGAITGSVAGFDGQPVAGACVTAVGAGRSVTTAAAPDGTFRLAGLPAGSYALEYRDCTAAGRNLTSSSGYLPTWSGAAGTQSTAARVQVAGGQVRQVPVVMLQPANVPAFIAARQASFQRTLAANGRTLTATAAAKTGQISGKVTGKGKPLSGICVRVNNRGHNYGARTGKNGTYTVRNVAPGRYYVIFASAFACPSHANWLQQVYKNDSSPQAPFNNTGTIVTVRAGHKTAGISGNLSLGGEISGTVTGKSGAKLRGICIWAGATFAHFRGFALGDKTAADGSFHLHALFPGKYTLYFRIGCGSGSENYAPATHPAVKLGLGQDLTINEALAPGASISGTVTLGSSTGTPLQGICVFAAAPRRSVFGFAASGSNGGYRIIGLTGGTYQVQVSPGCSNNGNYTSVSLTAQTTAGQETSNVNAVLQVAGEIKGTISDSHGPVSGICVEFLSNDFGGAEVPGRNSSSYVFDQLPAGTYQVGFFGGCGNHGSYAPNWYNNQPSESTATPINLALGQTVIANAEMQPGATITGKVSDAARNGLSGICVDATTRSAQDFFGLFFGARAGTRNGTYTLSNLAPGQYLISFGCGFGQRYASQWFPGAPDAGAAELVSAPVGRTSGINAVLQLAGSIRGVVTGQGGHPLAGACVAAVNNKGALPDLRGGSALIGLFGPFGIGGATQVGLTDQHGAFDISGLAAGRYKVEFSKCFPPRGYAEQWYRGKSSASAATDITVRPGKTTSGIDGHLVLGGSISGRVVNASGKPLSSICIVATNQSTNVVVGAFPGRVGNYSVPGLASGQYTIEFSPCGNQNLVTVVAHVTVTAPHATTGVNATMQPGGSIAGTVTAGSASGSPVSSSCVEVYSQGSAQPVGFGLTGLTGSYLATGLPAGTYQVYFNDPQCLFRAPGLAPQWYNNQSTPGTATPVTVTVEATTSSIDAALQPDGEITGTVSGSAGPLSGACVTAVPLTAGVSLPVVAVTGTTGYTLTDLLPGKYKVRFSAGCGAVGYATQWWPGVASRKVATGITVGASQTVSDINATLSKS